MAVSHRMKKVTVLTVLVVVIMVAMVVEGQRKKKGKKKDLFWFKVLKIILISV